MKELKARSDYAILCLLTARILLTSRLTEINPCIGSNIVAERSKLGGKPHDLGFATDSYL